MADETARLLARLEDALYGPSADVPSDELGAIRQLAERIEKERIRK